jgi:hypothetical protein
MNKYIIYIICFLTSAYQAKAQSFGFNVWGNNYMGVTNYNGNQSSQAITLRIECSCEPKVHLPNWKMSVRVTQPINSTDGSRTFPPEQLSLVPNRTVGNATPGPVPSITQIGVPAVVPLGLSEIFLVPQSNAPLHNESYWFYMEMSFDLVVNGGAYLGNLQGGDTQKRYPIYLEFKFYGPNNKVLGTGINKYDIDVFRLSGAPVEDKTYSLTVNGGARTGNLILQSRSDYESGTSVVYNNGLTVRTNTDYEVKVKATAPYFSYGSHTIDLDVVNMNLTTASPGVTGLNVITLSSSDQVIARGSSTSKQDLNFNVNYFINQNNKNKLLNAWKSPGSQSTDYSVSLQYTITPP